jgi:serine/threonine protein kinase
MIGTRLSHFRILAMLGEGGMGVVYRAEDERLRRQVALKVLPPELVTNEERRLRLLREARAAAAVSHPNIAAIYEIGEDSAIIFIAMELVEGKTLRHLIGTRPMPIRDSLRIACEIAEGLAHAHQARVIHRDLKPENVAVRVDEHVKILDFGLAKLLEEQGDHADPELSKLDTISMEITRGGRVFGTPAYMSPEQARGLAVDARSDLFSFGAVLYEMATARVAFRGATPTDTLTRIIHEQLFADADTILSAV